MSAIWGCIDFSKKGIAPGLCQAMQKPLEKYKLDRFHCCTHENAAMGCGLQLVRYNSEQERLPILDVEAGILFTMDGMIDNRKELSAILAPGEKVLPPDGTLAYLAYRKWGRECNEHMRGAYAFAAYDFGANTLMLSADHVFSRSLYYCRRGTKVYFGTILHSVADVLDTPPMPNHRWFADFLSMDSLRVMIEYLDTPFADIQKVGPRRYVLFTPKDQQSVVFWDPLAMPPLRLKDDAEYKEQFLSILRRAADEIAEGDSQAGIYVSSGMDSAAVAAIMAERLATENRILHSYTSVPMTNYRPIINRMQTEDETQGVMALCNLYPNIHPTFCPLDGVDALTNIQQIAAYYEIPFKSAPNMTWLYAIADQAHKDGCRIMLNGQMGNGTISWGSAFDLATTQLYDMHPFRAVQTISDYGKQLNISRKYLLKYWLGGNFPRLAGGRPLSQEEALEFCLVNREYTAQHNSIQRMNGAGFHNGVRQFYPAFQMGEKWMNQDGVTVLGESETKLGLANGLFIRDITKDKLLWEFCRRAPLECFVRNTHTQGQGQVCTRRAIRDYMGELLPPEIGQNQLQYGSQSADWVERLQRRWPEVRTTLAATLSSPGAAAFVDQKKVEDFLDQAGGASRAHSDHLLTNIMGAYTAMIIMEQFPKVCP